MLPERTLTKSPLLNVIIAAILNVSRGVRRDYSELCLLQNSKRNIDGFIASTMRRAQERLMEDLQKARPKFIFATEDMPLETNQEYWLVSPVIGIENLKRALPHFAMAVSYSRGDEIAASVIYDVLRDEIFWAERGGGAYVNRERIRISEPKKLEDCMCIVHPSQLASMMQNAKIKNEHIRILNCPALDMAYVAAARADMYIGATDSLFNIGASRLLLQEAGGTYKEQGNSVLAGNLDTLEKY